MTESSSSTAWWPPACVHILAPASAWSRRARLLQGDAAGLPAYGASGHACGQASSMAWCAGLRNSGCSSYCGRERRQLMSGRRREAEARAAGRRLGPRLPPLWPFVPPVVSGLPDARASARGSCNLGHTRRPLPLPRPPTLRCRRSRSLTSHTSSLHTCTRFTPQVDPKFLRNARFAAVKNQRKKKNTQ